MDTDINLIRLNKLIAEYGIASRRRADELIEMGKVRVNGKLEKEMSRKVNPSKDRIEVFGKLIKVKSAKIYILYNKPKGVTSTTYDTHAEKTLLDQVKIKKRVFPVGRLDKESRGLLLLTNDGELAFRLTHPKYHIPKDYRVSIKGVVSEFKIEHLRKGVHLEDGKTAPAKVSVLYQSESKTILLISLFEGKKREIRRMCTKENLMLIDLQRISIGSLTMGELEEGRWRYLTELEILDLYKQVGLDNKSNLL